MSTYNPNLKAVFTSGASVSDSSFISTSIPAKYKKNYKSIFSETFIKTNDSELEKDLAYTSDIQLLSDHHEAAGYTPNGKYKPASAKYIPKSMKNEIIEPLGLSLDRSPVVKDDFMDDLPPKMKQKRTYTEAFNNELTFQNKKAKIPKPPKIPLFVITKNLQYDALSDYNNSSAQTRSYFSPYSAVSPRTPAYEYAIMD